MTEMHGYSKKGYGMIYFLFLSPSKSGSKAKKIIPNWGSDQFKKFRIPRQENRSSCFLPR